MKVRSLAFKILQKVEKGNFAQDLLEEVSDITDRDRSLLTQLVYGTIRYQGALDKIIPPNNPLVNRIILRMAGYQLFFLSRIPKYAVVNESVELAKEFSTTKTSKFINAVLRNWCRHPPKITDKYSHPDWLVKRWENLFGKEDIEKLCKFNNEIPPIIVRKNTLRSIPKGVLEQLEVTSHPLGFVLKKPIGFKDGYFQAQDISSMYIVDLLDVKPGMRILDLCASPGGKTCHMAQLMQNKGEVIAVDVTKEKIKRLEENCERLGVTIVKTVVSDGKQVDLGKFDRILVDAPCSNTGVFRRRLEVRWRLKPSDFQRLAKIQLELLENASRQLKLDGKLVYSTCSIDPIENEGVIEMFLKKHSNFTLAETIKKTPYRDNMDGVFGAKVFISG